MDQSKSALGKSMSSVNLWQQAKVFENEKAYFQAYQEMLEKVKDTTAIYKGAPVPFLVLPKVFLEKDIYQMEQAVASIFSLVNKTIDLYLEKEEVRAMFDFDARLEALIRVPSKYKTHVPMGRFDIFYKANGDYQFCELNTDGTSAQSEEDGLSKMFLQMQPLQDIYKEGYSVQTYELFDTWVASVKEIYKECKAVEKKERPYVAIVDFFEGPPKLEFEMFKASFTNGGFECEIVDPRDIVCQEGQMVNEKDQRKIDIVYRRLVTKDLMDRYDEIPGFVEGILSNKTCIIGNIKSQVVHTKLFFAVLHKKEFQAFLSEEEIAYIHAHIPFTKQLKDIEDLSIYMEDKDAYLIKPVDYYASKGVYSGQDMTKEEWEERLLSTGAISDLIQRYCPVSESKNIIFENKKCKTVSLRNITGMYVYNEKLCGLYSRAGLNSIISGLHEGYTLPSYVLEKNA